MGLAIDTISFSVTQPNTGAAMAAITGDAATIRNSAAGKDILCLAAWAKTQAVSGYTQILWPSGHDLVRGLRARHIYAQIDQIIPAGMPLAFRPQDPLTLTQSGSNTASDLQFLEMLIWYEDLPGVDAHLINTAYLRQHGSRVLTVEDTITASTEATYSGALAMNHAADLFRANTNYAIAGVQAGVIGAALTVRGPDTGNLRAPLPCNASPNSYNQDWFIRLSGEFGLPTIPVFNSANRAGTFIELVQDENKTAVPFSLVLVELDEGVQPTAPQPTSPTGH
jgi:hypothetical protein